MDAFDLNKISTAITYMDRIAEGRNPVNNCQAPDDEILNDPNVIRCMLFVKEILESVKQNGGIVGGYKREQKKPYFPLDVLKDFEYQEDKTITNVVGQINELIDGNEYRKLTYMVITDWLKAKDFLAEEYSDIIQKKITVPTEKGRKIGIVTEDRTTPEGNGYIAVIYTKPAQQFIIQNMGKFLQYNKQRKYRKKQEK